MKCGEISLGYRLGERMVGKYVKGLRVWLVGGKGLIVWKKIGKMEGEWR